MSWFIAGTDTGAGKTWFTARAVRELRRRGCDALGLKPVCCGGREDAEELFAANERQLPLELVNPCFLRAPVTPLVAASLEHTAVDIHSLAETVRRCAGPGRILLVEGVGGWMAPVAPGQTFGDFAGLLRMPVLLVAANRLGALNHTLLTVEAIRRNGLNYVGVVLNQVSTCADEACLTNAQVLRDFGVGPVWEVEFEGPLPGRLIALLQGGGPEVCGT